MDEEIERELGHLHGLVSLRFEELNRRLEERQRAGEQRLELFASANDQVHTALTDQVDVLRTIATQHIPRAEYATAHNALAERLAGSIDLLRDQVAALELRVQSRIEYIEGQALGLRRGWVFLVGGVSTVAAAAAVIGVIVGR